MYLIKKELPKTIKVHGETFELTEDWGENSWYRNIVNRKGIEERHGMYVTCDKNDKKAFKCWKVFI